STGRVGRPAEELSASSTFSTIFDTAAVQTLTSSGITPLITPIIAAPFPITTSVNMCGNNAGVDSNGTTDSNIDTTVIIIMASLLFLLIVANLGALVVCLTKRRKKKKNIAVLMEGSNNTTAPRSTHNDEAMFEILSTNEAYISRGITVRDNPAYWKPQGRPRMTKRSLSWSGSYAYVRRFS
ncbi:hypothetical protein GBAR_LOCUS6301, partial [Geodia barretti]